MLKHRYFTIAIIAILLVALIGQVYAATSPTFGASGSYSVLAGTRVTNTGSTFIDGDVGVSPGSEVTGFFPPGIVNGSYSIHRADGSAANAQLDNVALFAALSAAPNVPCDVVYTGTKDLVELTLLPGVYCADAFDLSGTLYLDDSGDPPVPSSYTWIFRSAAALNTADGSPVTAPSVQFTDGDNASVCDVWWQVASSATIGAYTTFIGNILALTSIDLDTGATLEGRAFAQNGAVTLDSNTIGAPICLGRPAPVATATPRRTAVPDDEDEEEEGSGLPAFPGTGSGAPIFSEVSPWILLIIAGILATALVVGGRSLRRNDRSK